MKVNRKGVEELVENQKNEFRTDELEQFKEQQQKATVEEISSEEEGKFFVL